MKQVLRIIGGLSVLVTLCPPRAAEGAFASRLEAYEDRNPILGGRSTEQFLALQDRQGPCSDDREVTAPFLDGDPIMEEDDAFFSRPLKFGHPVGRTPIDEQGFLDSVTCSLLDARIRRART